MIDRRTLLAVTAAAMLPLPSGRAAPALAVPMVDGLELVVLIDNVTGVFGTGVERADFRMTPPPVARDYHASFAGQWGYSLLARSRAGATERTTLIDFGYTAEALGNNMALLGIAPERIDAMVLSHGHYDHFGGLDGLLASGKLRRGTPLYIGGEEAFCTRIRGTTADGLPFGEIDRPALARAGIVLKVGGDPEILAGQGFTTGRIPFVSPERPRVPTGMLPGQHCERSLLAPAKRDRDFVVDDAEHELGTAFHVAGRGLVVIGSCSHRGIVNTVRQAQRVSGIEKVHAIVGGFHLVPPQTREQALETLALIQAIGPDYVIPGHCTGDFFVNAAMAAMPDRVMRSVVGASYRFGR